MSDEKKNLQYIFTLSEGDLIITWPRNISHDEIDLGAEFLELVLKRMRRFADETS